MVPGSPNAGAASAETRSETAAPTESSESAEALPEPAPTAAPAEKPQAPAAPAADSIPTSTTDTISGKKIARSLQAVGARRVFDIDVNMGSDGRSEPAETTLAEMEAAVMDDLKQAAADIGGNAVVGIRIQVGSLTDNAQFVAGCGTAVVIQ